MNLFKKILLGVFAMSLLLGSAFNASARENRHRIERRIFLWDVTISMVGATTKSPDRVDATPRTNPDFGYEGWQYDGNRDIFDKVREELIANINDIEGDDVEIVVVPYTNKWGAVMSVKTSTRADKDRIISQIRSWNSLAPAGTYTGKCLQQVIDTYFNSGENVLNRVILLTDGVPDKSDKQQLLKIIRSWNQDKELGYDGNRLVYVMLGQEAQSKDLAEEFEKLKNDENNNTGLLESLEDLKNYKQFSLGGLDQEHTILETEFPEGFVVTVECNKIMGDMSSVKCIFSTDSPYVSVDETSISPVNGKFVIPVKYTYGTRDEYRDEIRSSGKRCLPVEIACAVDPSCSDVQLEGNDAIYIDLSVAALPKAVISISTK